MRERDIWFFPWAGGGPQIAVRWGHLCEAKVRPIVYPGHASRFGEALLTDVGDLASVVATEILDARSPSSQQILVGHSLGAIVAFEVAQRLEANGTDVSLLVVSGCAAPHLGRVSPLHELSDDKLLQAISQMSKRSADALAHEALRDIALPVLRADLLAAKNYRYDENAAPLSCPILALAGLDDSYAPPRSVREWEAHTSSSFRLEVFAGSHLFIEEHVVPVLATIERVVALQHRSGRGT